MELQTRKIAIFYFVAGARNETTRNEVTKENRRPTVQIKVAFHSILNHRL